MRIAFFITLFCIGFLWCVETVMARPVSYPGGWTGMIMNTPDTNSFHAHYSPTARYSVGYKIEHWRDDDYTLHMAQMNNLLNRWNGRDYQANIYLKSGLGISDNTENDGLAGFSGVALDWENRRFFTSYENRYTKVSDVDDFYMQSARVGVAPYIGDYGDLHTWFMLQVDHQPENQHAVTVMPMVRFFKDVHLVEAGINNQGSVLFNWVIRY